LYVSISVSLYALLHCLFAMYPFTSSGSFRFECFCRCLSLLPVALIVVSAYPFFFMYQRTFGILQCLLVGDGVALLGDDVAVPDRH